MERFRLVRIDSRLIHGQVITKWLKRVDANKIIIIDNQLANDDFMKSIYVMAAPSDVKVEVYTIEDAIAQYNEDQFGSDKILVLMKDVQTTYDVIKNGLAFPKVQIGGLGAGPNKKKAYGPIYFSDQDFKQLKELHDEGVDIVLHQVPDEAALEFSKVIPKFS